MLILGMLLGLPGVEEAQAASPCDPPVASPIACENSKPGNPSSEWDISGSGDTAIQGFATDMSVNKGETVRFKIKTAAVQYRLDIYRLGYYAGNGARKVATVNPSASLPQSQPACLDDPGTGLHDCGNWAESASWAVPSTAVSGVYIARLVMTATGGASHIVFVVRDDASTSAVLFQTSDTTWQAYNSYGDSSDKARSMYPGPNGAAVKVSYNRPFTTRGDVPGGRDFVFANEYPMIRWLEANGYDTTYTTDVDSDRRGDRIKQHKLFLSVGHDEYWSAAHRTNVEAARDAGVNLGFFGGNSVYWKTRWENSTDGSATPYRTLVTYKETKSNAKVDPDPAWTGTWRDPRFSPPADGGRPENQLMGTAYKVNTGEFAIEVPEADGKMRLWRNTSVATLSPGTKATLEANTLGYEWDEDLDNGFRPAGLIRLSSTTKNVDEYLYDYGNTVKPGVATHNLTMYRAPSGALVFGAGTIQWSWGLDGNHDGTPGDPDQRMRQATVNLFADMGIQPATIQSGTSLATKSTDTAAPTAVITSPSPGASLASGSTATVQGTATDAGGGRVGGVEVSTDGGKKWHRADGRETWSYSWSVTGAGTVTVKARATDDSGNIQASPAAVDVNVSCPCTIFAASAAPVNPDGGDTSPIEVGVKFRTDLDATISGVRFYKSAANTGTHVGSLWAANGTKLASATFTGESSSGWQQVNFATPVEISAFTTYIASYYAPAGGYSGDANYFAGEAVDNPPLHALKNGTDGGNGVYRYGGGFPNQTYGAANYWVDVVVASTGPPDTTPPTVAAGLPEPGSTTAPVTAKVQAKFSERIDGPTVSFTLRDGAGNTVAGSVAYDDPTRTSTFTPAAALGAGATYTATVSGAKDLSGNTMASPSTWSFTTTSAPPRGPGECPCTIWNDSVVPATPANSDANGIEVGVKFRADKDGTIDAIRFYKGLGNDGPHVGSLWTTSGTRLGTVDFTMESTEGWQQASFASPVAITAGTTYVASYFAPNGRYASNSNYFGAATDSPPLHALADGADGPNGVYLYGTGGFPTQTYGAANYWVDVVFTVPPDLTAPTVVSTSPGAGAKSVPVSAGVKAVFSEPVQPDTVAFTLKDTANNVVAATVAYDAPTRTATLTPTATLGAAAGYSATVSGAEDLAGNPLAATLTWSFTTSGVDACPCTIFDTSSVPATPASSDTGAIEVGVKFRADVDGYVEGVRFYKGSGNTGTHVGALWTAAGANLASATFTSETATGWQQVNFTTPVAVTAGTTYVASYFAPNGRYASNSNFFAAAADNPPLRALANGTEGGNGVYLYGGGFPTQTYGAANYWVDVSFTTTPPPDTTPPTVSTTNPAGGATSVPVGTAPTATFAEDVQASTVSMTLVDAANAAVGGTRSYDSTTRTVTFTPSTALAAATKYTATVSGAKDVAGNAMTAPATWSFTTAKAASPPGTCPCTIWTDATQPTSPSGTDTAAIEVGVKFRSDTNGYIYGVRFYKGTGNTGTHVGNLWTTDGTKLATATFAGESTTGWQQVDFASPVAVTAGTTYIASYHAPNGRYAADAGYFASAGVTRGPLTALANGVDGANGVYLYGAGGFPTNSYGSANYWVDVSFSKTPPDTTAPTVTAKSPNSGATGVSRSTKVTATFSEAVQAATVSLTLEDNAGGLVPGTLTYDAATRKASFKPSSILLPLRRYAAAVGGAKDSAGNAMAAPVTWSFTTRLL